MFFLGSPDRAAGTSDLSATNSIKQEFRASSARALLLAQFPGSSRPAAGNGRACHSSLMIRLSLPPAKHPALGASDRAGWLLAMKAFLDLQQRCVHLGC